MIFLLFISLFLFAKPTFALTLSVSVTETIPTSGVIGNPFQVNVLVTNGDIGATYYYKIFGGFDSAVDQVKTAKGNVYLPYTGV